MIAAALIVASCFGTSERWDGLATHQGKQWAVALDLAADSPGSENTADFPEFGIYGLPLNRKDSNSASIALSGFLQSRVIRIEAVRDGEIIEGELEVFGTKTQVRLNRSDQHPTPLVTHDMSCSNGKIQLSGTLILPAAAGPFPVVILTHGSGRQGRTSTFYRSRAIYFARQGIASLIYDKRGVGESTGEWERASVHDLARDALAWVDVLKKRGDIDARRIGIEGSSQGGWIAPIAASSTPNLAFVIVGSAPGVSPAEQNNFSVRSNLLSSQADDTTIEEILNLRRKLDRYYETGTGKNEVVAALEAVNARHGSASWFANAWLPTLPLIDGGPGTDNHYTTEDMLLDPSRYWSRVTVPVLAMWGENDRDVPAQRSMEVLKAVLAHAGNTHASLHIFSGSGHGFSVTTSDEWDFPRLAPEYAQRQLKWLQTTVLNID